MALLKGGTVVDGDLFIEDSLRAHNIQDLDGKNFPYVDTSIESGYTDRVIRFSNNESGIVPTGVSIIETFDDQERKLITVMSFPGQEGDLNSHAFQIDAQAKNIKVVDSEITLDPNTSVWHF